MLPAPVVEIVQHAYGDATGTLFLVAAGFAVITLLAVAVIPNRELRTTIDLVEEPSGDERTKDTTGV